MSAGKITMPYGKLEVTLPIASLTQAANVVRLGKSGLKVSRIILGCMSYGNKSWQGWLLEEKEGIEHIKTAFAAGINVSMDILA